MEAGLTRPATLDDGMQPPSSSALYSEFVPRKRHLLSHRLEGAKPAKGQFPHVEKPRK